MKNNAVGKLFSIDSIPLKYKAMFGDDLDIYDVLTLCKDPLRDMGSFGTRRLLFKSRAEDGIVKLPSCVYSIKSVTTSRPLSIYETFFVVKSETRPLVNYRVNPYKSNGMDEGPNDVINQVEEDDHAEVFQIVQRNTVVQPPRGAFVDYIFEDGVLKGIRNGTAVDVIFTEVALDGEGFPMFNEKVQLGLIYYMHFIKIQKDFYKKLADVNMLQMAKHDKDVHIAQARTPIKISDNQMDDLLNVFTSNNKKQHNIPFK